MTAFQVLQILALYLGLIFAAAIASILFRAKMRRIQSSDADPKFPDVDFNVPFRHADKKNAIEGESPSARGRVAYSPVTFKG